jgi:hypothetical protein
MQIKELCSFFYFLPRYMCEIAQLSYPHLRVTPGIS